mgnify:CR=1 FL=1
MVTAPPLALKTYIDERLPSPIRFRNRHDPSVQRSLAAAYLADHGRWDAALEQYCSADVAAQARIFDYLFRKLAGAERYSEARIVARTLIEAAVHDNAPGQYADQAAVARFYLQLLGTGR